MLGNNFGSPRGPVDPQLLRAVCGHYVTGVTVVTTKVGGHAYGLTINSFASVSLDPPLVLFCIHQKSSIRPLLRDVRVFAVNILAEDQEHLSRTFATRGVSRFDTVPSDTGVSGAPILSEALAYLDCEVRDEMDGGDHTIVLGEVVDLGVLRGDSNPLTFFRSLHGRLGTDR